MTVEILVPDLPESVADATVATWYKKAGDRVKRDDVVVDIETDKVVLEVPAPEDGILEEILEQEGATVLSKQLLAKLAPAPVAGEPTKDTLSPKGMSVAAENTTKKTPSEALAGPSVRRTLAEHDIEATEVTGTGNGGRITQEDVASHLSGKQAAPTPMAQPLNLGSRDLDERNEKRVPMTRLRKRVAERLLEVKNNTAMLTTFNEVNMKPIMSIRKQYQEEFEKRHDIRLGFMSFFVKAAVEALKRYPEVNASIDGDDIVYHNYFDVSIAVSTPRGLVTPVLRNCDTMSLAEIEKEIKTLSLKAQAGKLSVDELIGGNFTITNGGVFGSLMSTPIINPPQAAILGMHKIQDRPMAVDGKVEILPMMYLALSYDHRLIDGKESVSFLVTIKSLLEDPTRLLLDV